MRENVMRAAWPGVPDLATEETSQTGSQAKRRRQAGEWNPEQFAQEQIRGLVRKVFFSTPDRVRQVVFTSVEPETDVLALCKSVGIALARETASDVAVAGALPQLLDDSGELPPSPEQPSPDGAKRQRRLGTRIRGNLWMVPRPATLLVSAASLHQHLSQIRSQFEYSVVEADAVAESFEAIAMAQFADGIILVLSAQHTRRATARRAKEIFETTRARLIGVVLSDRLFPMPSAIYRRL